MKNTNKKFRNTRTAREQSAYKYITYLFIFILLSISVNAWYSGSMYYNFQNDNTDNGTLGLNRDLAGTHTGGYKEGIIQQAINCSPIDTIKGISTSSANTTAISEIKTIDVWVRTSNLTGALGDFVVPFALYNSTDYTNNRFFFWINSNEKIQWLNVVDGVNINKIGDSNILGYTWYHVVMVFGDGNMTLYLNGNLTQEISNETTQHPDTGFDTLEVCWNSDNERWNGLIDNLYFTSYRYTPQNVTDSYNSGAGIYFGFDDIYAPTFSGNKTNETDLSPKSTDVLQINITVTDDIDISSIRLSDNQSGIMANVSIQEFNGYYDTSITAIFNLTVNMDNGRMGWQIWANDSTGNSAVSEIYTVEVYDITSPVIISHNPSKANSTIIYNTGIININATITDNNQLYVINLSIEKNGIDYYNFSDYISGTSYSLYKSPVTSAWANVTYVEKLRVCDTHTKKQIKDATSIITQNDSLRFQFEDIWVKIKSINGNEYSASSEKLDDRYTFEFNYKSETGLKAFELTSNERITYLPNSDYKGHFIIGDRLWIDFENDKGADISTEKTDEGYIIYIDNPSETLRFSSIGYLNCIEEHYLFELSSKSPDASPYDITLLTGNFFNTEILDTSTTAGVLLFFFLFIILIALVIFGEYSEIPVIMLLTGLYGFFYGLLLYVIISAIMGFIMIILSIFYIIRSIVFS